MVWLLNRQRANHTYYCCLCNYTQQVPRTIFRLRMYDGKWRLKRFSYSFSYTLGGGNTSPRVWSKKSENNVPLNFPIPHSPHASVRTTVGRFTLRLGRPQEEWALGNMAASNVSWFQMDIRWSILFYLYTTTVQKLRKCQWIVLDSVAALLVHQCYKREWFMYNITLCFSYWTLTLNLTL